MAEGLELDELDDLKLPSDTKHSMILRFWQLFAEPVRRTKGKVILCWANPTNQIQFSGFLVSGSVGSIEKSLQKEKWDLSCIFHI